MLFDTALYGPSEEMRMPTGTRNVATGSSSSKHVGATSQAAVGAIAVAFEVLSDRLALGPLCPAPDTSNFDTAWSRFRTEGSKQHPCQTTVPVEPGAYRLNIAKVSGRRSSADAFNLPITSSPRIAR
jgi:hypothetical protein